MKVYFHTACRPSCVESLIKKLQKKFVALGIIYLPVATIIVQGLSNMIQDQSGKVPGRQGACFFWRIHDPLLGTFFLPQNASISKSSGSTILREVINFSKLEKVVIVVNPPKPK